MKIKQKVISLQLRILSTTFTYSITKVNSSIRNKNPRPPFHLKTLSGVEPPLFSI